MWATAPENQGSFLSRYSIRRNQVASAEGDGEDLDSFQRKIADQFSDLLPSSSDELMSIAWIQKLLDAFLFCEAEFRATFLVGRDPSHIIKSPLDRLIPDLLDRFVKALDICNAVTHGVDAIRFVKKHAEIAVVALEERPFTDGQIRRAKKALAAVLSSIATDEKESNANRCTERSWSFGQRGTSSTTKDHRINNFRSLSWSVSKNWSAAKQIQAMSSNLYPPRGADPAGLSMLVYIMSVVMNFIMWTMVAAIPCQERAGLGAHGPVPRQRGWAHGMSSIQEKIVEEWKKKEKKGANVGLMEEVLKLEKIAQSLVDCFSHFQFPMEDEKEDKVAAHVAELTEICSRMEDGLGPLQRQIREVFHQIVRSRVEVLDVFDHAAKASSAPNV